MQDLLASLKSNPFVLAPMAGITDVAFRSFMKSMGSSVLITELVSATGIKFGSAKTLDLMKFEPYQHPIGIQIFGDTLEDLAYASKIVENTGADFLDLNFGCPVPKVVKKGGGSAILKDLDRVAKVFQAVRSSTRLPVTVKIRTGWDENSKVAVEICNIAYNEGLTWVAIHGRTRSQAYKGYADWGYISEVKSKSKIPIIGNGDLCTPEQAVQRLVESGCDGVMIGRGCLKNPWLFQQSLSLWNNNRDSVFMEFVEVFNQLNEHYANWYPDRIRALQLKKLSSWYSYGLPDSTSFRKRIFQLTLAEEVLAEIKRFFSQYSNEQIVSQNNEGFLMGGHG